MSIFSERLTKLMEGHDVNDQILADELGVSRTTVTRWRSGERSPKLNKIPEIASYFKVDPSYFVEKSDDNQIDMDGDDTFVMIQRKAKKMTPEQRSKTLRILEATFDDDDLWEK